MSLIAHCALPRQGKSYSAVLYIIDQLARGRRVVTNIEGMGTDKRKAMLRKLVEAKGGTWDGAKFVHILHSKIERMIIFPVDTGTENEEGIRVYDDSKSVLKMGDALVWDEARLWKTGKLPEIWAEALDYHGHWAKNGFSTDILVITPQWMSLAPTIRRGVEVLYMFEKHPGGEKFTRWLYKAPGDKDISPPHGSLDEEVFTIEKETVGQCYATNSDPDSIAADTLLKPMWKTWRYWKKIMIGLGLILFSVVGLYLLGRSFFASTDLEADKQPAGRSSPASGSGSSSAGSLGAFAGQPVADQRPRVVGILPSARGGKLAIVKIGERYEYAQVVAGIIKFKGETLQWPDAY